MAWTHSYTPEAYDIARRELDTWTREDLCKAIAEFNYQHAHGGFMREGHPHHKGYRVWHRMYKDRHIAHDTLVNNAMDCIMTVYTCDNGAHAMWIDYDGYYTVELPQEDI